MIRVIIDTGVVVSAAFRDRTPEEVLIFVAGSKDLEWVVSPSILLEYDEVLARKKFGLSDDVLAKWRQTFRNFTTLVEPDLKIDFQRDQKDSKFLECAFACKADYLITGDADFEDAVSETRIISVTQFRNEIMTGLNL